MTTKLFRTYASHVLRPRNQVDGVIQRLVDATERIAPVTLAVSEASLLLTFIRHARRLAALTDEAPAADAEFASDDVASLRAELDRAEQAWAAAERRLYQIELKAVPRETSDDTPVTSDLSED